MENHHFQWENMGKSTISMAISNSYVTNYQRVLCMYIITSGVELIWDYRCHSCSRKKMIWLKSGTNSWTLRKNSWLFRFPKLKSGAKSSSQAFNLNTRNYEMVKSNACATSNFPETTSPPFIYIYIFIYLFIYLIMYIYILCRNIYIYIYI